VQIANVYSEVGGALKKSIGRETAGAPTKKRKAAAGQKEMLLPISGKKKEEPKKAAKAPAARSRKRA
jgi:DNA end-binding protein Ku